MDVNAFIQKLGLTKLIVGLSALLLTGWLFYFFTDQMTKPDMALLYGDLDVGDAGRIVAKLEDRNIPVEIRGDGTQVYVPVDQVARLRMDMAEAGLPSGGSVGYEIFDQSDVFGTSFFVQNVNHVRALEGELARTIRTINQIASARVHLVLPRRELFNNEKQEPTASIVIRMNTPGRLDEARVQSIQHLVAAAVPNLLPERVAVVDDRGNLLSSGGGTASEVARSIKTEEAKTLYETKLETAIRSLLERTLGVGKVRAQISADMDFDRLVENSEIFDADKAVPRSTLSVEESGDSSESQGASGSSVANELPGAAGGTGESKNNSKRTEETVNYEISKTISSLTKEGGRVKKLSIAVLVDGKTTKGQDGKEAYEPRSADELKQIEKLVKSAVGFDEKRGDTLEVVNMQFKEDPLDAGTDGATSMFDFQPHDIVRMIEVLVLGVIGLLMLLLVIRPFFARLFEAMNESTVKQDTPIQAPPMVVPNQVTQTVAVPPSPSNDEGTVTLNQVDGEVKKSSVNKVSEIIEKHPEETVSLVRNWMNQ